MDTTLDNINPTEEQSSSKYNPSDSLAKTMWNPLKTKDNDLASTVWWGSPKDWKNQKTHPNQISIGLDKYEDKLSEKRN